ncbi:ribonuclease P protein component [Buchnera aphidicola (Formosaphis micheliae)]|uniref:ribonuclease P protein component n=1 Tax=Buchnera aphidicola TaxID=9 RepID=UPI0031B85FE4
MNKICLFFFTEEFRLSKAVHFNFVFTKPFRVKISEIILLGRYNSLKNSRIGISISKKNIKYAHERNRLKRVIRETFRVSKCRMIGIDFIIIVTKNAVKINSSIFREKLNRLWLNVFKKKIFYQ